MAALTDEVIKGLTPEQKNNLKRLAELAEKEEQVDEKIQRLFEEGAYSEDGVSLTPCSDWDDFRVINAFQPPEKQHPLYREITGAREQIKETLRESLRLDLGYLGLIQRQCKNYQVEM